MGCLLATYREQYERLNCSFVNREMHVKRPSTTVHGVNRAMIVMVK